MKYKIYLRPGNKIAELNTTYLLAFCIAKILGFLYDVKIVHLYNNTKKIVVPAYSGPHNGRPKTLRNEFEPFLFMNTQLIYEKKSHTHIGEKENMIALMNLPRDPFVLEIGGLFLNTLSYPSIDILKNRGKDGRFQNLIELYEFSCEQGCRYSILSGSREDWFSVISE